MLYFCCDQFFPWCICTLKNTTYTLIYKLIHVKLNHHIHVVVGNVVSMSNIIFVVNFVLHLPKFKKQVWLCRMYSTYAFGCDFGVGVVLWILFQLLN